MQAWLHTTLAYTFGSPAAEWASAVAYCSLAGMWGWHITQMQTEDLTLTAGSITPDTSMPAVKWVLLAVIWLLAVSIFCLPVILYVMSLSVPPTENTLRFNGGTSLHGLQASIGLISAIISSYVVPPLARKAVATFGSMTMNEAGIAQTAGELMMLARFICYVLAPSVTVLLTTDACFAKWYVSLTFFCHF